MGRAKKDTSTSSLSRTDRLISPPFPHANTKINSVSDLFGWPEPTNRKEINHFYFKNNIYDIRTLFKDSNEISLTPEFWRQQLNGFEAKGFKVRIPEFNDSKLNPIKDGNAEMTSIAGKIYDKDKLAGHIGLQALLGVDGKIELRIGKINMNKSVLAENNYIGKGFGSAMIQKLEQVCKTGDIKRISLNAVHIGCYAWAKSDFDFDPRYYKEKYPNCSEYLKRRFKNNISLALKGEADLEQILDNIEKADLKRLKDFARYQDGKLYGLNQMSIGKIGLYQNGWKGVKLVS